ITNYTEDDGQELQSLRWMPDDSAIFYTRGGTANPASRPSGVSEGIWTVALDGAPPRRLSDGTAPVISSRGGRMAFVRSGQISGMPVDGRTPPQGFQARGSCDNPVWSPDSESIAFVTHRGDHSLIGVYHVSAATLRYLDPSSDDDSNPVWSP